MAQTKRKRRTKHRGTAAGTIAARGRTGRPLSPEEKKRQARADAREKRMSTPPTWQSSFKRAGLAAAFMFVVLLVISHPKKGSPVVSALLLAAIAFLIYAPLGYYLEVFMFRRRMKQRAASTKTTK